MTTLGEIPDPIRRRLGLPESDQLAQAAYRVTADYHRLVLALSSGQDVDADELLRAAAAAGRTPLQALQDRDVAKRAYDVWRNCLSF